MNAALWKLERDAELDRIILLMQIYATNYNSLASDKINKVSFTFETESGKIVRTAKINEYGQILKEIP